MDKLTYGLVITLVGMGGTLLGLYLIVCMVQILKKLLPYKPTEEAESKGVN